MAGWHAVAALFALGLGIRLVLAYVSEGFWYDVTLFKLWSNRLADEGVFGFYEATGDYTVDYPPGYLYVLTVLGRGAQVVFGHGPTVPFLKLPAIAADMLLAVAAMVIAPQLSAGAAWSRLPPRTLAAAAILLNPAVILVSAVWGQVDSVMAVLVLASVWLLLRPPSAAREIGAITLLAVMLGTKPQGVFALPLVAIFLWWRHGAHGRTLIWISALAAAGAVILVAMFLPFGVAPWHIAAFYRDAGSLYPLTSLWAFNVWGAFGFYRPDTGAGGLTILGVDALHVGLVAFIAGACVVVHRFWRALTQGQLPAAAMLVGVAAMTCVAFALLTRVHERYLYLAVAALAPFVSNSRLRLVFVTLTVCFLLNVHFVYVMHSHQAAPPGDAWTIGPLYDALFGTSQDAVQRKILSLVTAAVCLWTAVCGWSSLSAGAAARTPPLRASAAQAPSVESR